MKKSVPSDEIPAPSLGPLLRIGRTEFLVLAGRKVGDLTSSGAEVLVVPADTGYVMRGQLTYKVRMLGGDEIAARLRQSKPLVPGDVVSTEAGRLPARALYHAVITSWSKTQKAGQAPYRVLQATIWRVVSRCMELAQLTGMESIAFPSLGTGSGKADRFETHSTLTAACFDTLHPDSSLRRILFCFNDLGTARIFQLAFLQQRLLRQARGLTVRSDKERDRLDANLQKIWPLLTGVNTNLEKLAALVSALEAKPSATVFNFNVGDIIGSTGVAIGPNAQATVTRHSSASVSEKG